MSRTENQKMADEHETYLIEQIGGRMPKGSGNQWRDRLDGKHELNDMMGFAWDAKSTRKKSYSITKALWEKVTEQACGQRPMVPIRFYPEHGLKPDLDLVAISLDDFTEMLETIRDLKERVNGED